MIENTPYNDNLDKYLLGKLSADEKSAMDAQFAADSHLKDDMLLQQDIVHALQAERRMELKNRLDSIEVGAGGFSTAIGLKIAAGVALVGLLGVGTYFYLNSEALDDAELPVGLIELPATDQGLALAVPAKPEAAAYPINNIPENSSTAVIPTPAAEKPVAAPAASQTASIREANELKANDTADAAEEVARPQVQVQKPQVLSDFSEKEINGAQQPAEVPVDAMARNREFSTQTIEVTAQLHERWDFHYQFYDSKLFIYGDFKNKPYEILEINTDGSTSYFLYFERNYYGLKNNQQKLTKLRKLANEKLIRELNITRNQKINP